MVRKASQAQRTRPRVRQRPRSGERGHVAAKLQAGVACRPIHEYGIVVCLNVENRRGCGQLTLEIAPF